MSTKTKKTIASTKTKASKGEKKEPGKTKKSKLTPKDVAEYFLRLTEPEVGDAVSNKQIQNLLYYAQGFSLALNNKPLFEDDFVAWMYGPVIPSLYDLYEEYEESPVPVNKNINLNKFSKKDRDVLIKVFNKYGQYSAWKLRDLSCEEQPYRETRIKEVISKELIKDYFYIQIKYNELKNKKSKS